MHVFIYPYLTSCVAYVVFGTITGSYFIVMNFKNDKSTIIIIKNLTRGKAGYESTNSVVLS